MSKNDQLRALREAKYARDRAAAGQPRTRTAAPVAPAVTSTPTTPSRRAKPAAPVVAASEPSSAEALCGHKSINGRTCTRERGHAAKNHRYS